MGEELWGEVSDSIVTLIASLMSQTMLKSTHRRKLLHIPVGNGASWETRVSFLAIDGHLAYLYVGCTYPG